MENPLVSVIIITYNQRNYIHQAVDSVLMQQVDFCYELILADDCSTDDTPDILRAYEEKDSRVRTILRKENVGASQNYMLAARQARGKYLVVFEGDDYWIDSRKLQTQVDFLQANPEYFGVSHVLEKRDDAGRFFGCAPSSRRIVGKDATMPLFLRGITFSCVATLYHNLWMGEAVESRRVQYVTRHRMVADFALCMLFLNAGRVKVLSNAMSAYRISSAATTNQTSYNATHSGLRKYQDALDVLRYSEEYWEGRYKFGRLYITSSFYPCVEALRTGHLKPFLQVFRAALPPARRAAFWLWFPFRCAKELAAKLGKMLRGRVAS